MQNLCIQTSLQFVCIYQIGKGDNTTFKLNQGGWPNGFFSLTNSYKSEIHSVAANDQWLFSVYFTQTEQRQYTVLSNCFIINVSPLQAMKPNFLSKLVLTFLHVHKVRKLLIHHFLSSSYFTVCSQCCIIPWHCVHFFITLVLHI